MRVTRKCRAKGGVNNCDDPNCPEKVNHMSNLSTDFNKRLDIFNEQIHSTEPRLDADIFAMFGLTSNISKPADDYINGKYALEAQVTAGADYVIAELGDMEFEDRNSFRNTAVPLKSLTNPEIARNNCWTASNSILENVTAEDFGVDELTMVNLENEQEYHTALYAVRNGEGLVVDFTAKQFNPEAAFPMISTLAEWQSFVQERTGWKMSLTIGADDMTARDNELQPLST